MFFKRLKEARLKFKEGGVEGWQTDRGRVYVRNGPPDRIESQPGVAGSMSPYSMFEIWYYDATNARYVFEDFGGSGTYTLVDVVQG
jgi:GWxTD domain-containing protein